MYIQIIILFVAASGGGHESSSRQFCRGRWALAVSLFVCAPCKYIDWVGLGVMVVSSDL